MNINISIAGWRAPIAIELPIQKKITIVRRPVPLKIGLFKIMPLYIAT